MYGKIFSSDNKSTPIVHSLSGNFFMVAVNRMQIYIIKVYITFECFPQTPDGYSSKEVMCNIKYLNIELTCIVYCSMNKPFIILEAAVNGHCIFTEHILKYFVCSQSPGSIGPINFVTLKRMQ